MSEKDIMGSFEFIGQHPSDVVIKKCSEICITYGIDAEELVEHWSAYSITYLKSASVSLDGIASLEQKVLSKKHRNPVQENCSEETKTHKEDSNKKLIIKAQETQIVDDAPHEFEPSKDVNTQENLKLDDNEDEKADGVLYANRINSEKVVVSFGKERNYSPSNQLLNVRVYGNSNWYKPDTFTALYTTQSRIANCFDRKIEEIGQIILRKNKLILEDEGNVIIYGRIKSEDRGKVNNKSVVMETQQDFKGPKEVILNISNTQNYSIFSGQIIAVKGITAPKNAFVVHEVYSDASPEPDIETPTFSENLQIFVAAGPFTIADNFLYEPLQDLLKQVVQQKPNILIIIGPFIDSAHPKLLDIPESFEEHFEILIKNIMECLVGWPINVVLIPSSSDVHNCPTFPTPSYVLKQHYENLICAPNPCVLNIDGFILATTSLDILFQLTKEEVSRNSHIKDRMSRLASHLLNQRSFCPLYPNRDVSAYVDYEHLLNDCTMDVKPNLLILPSTLRYFIKNVDNCLVVNLQRLVKNHIGGTYAIINVNPSLNSNNIVDCISCQIKNI